MAETIDQILSDIAPQFDSIDPNRRQRMIDYASRWLSDKCTAFNGLYNDAVAYLTAHLLTLTTEDAAGGEGVVSSRREGDLAITYAIPELAGDWAQTKYGVVLQALMNSQIFGMITIATKC